MFIAGKSVLSFLFHIPALVTIVVMIGTHCGAFTANRKDALIYLALKQIQAIYREENKLADMTSEERLKHCQLTVKSLVDAHFAWVKDNISKAIAKANNLKPYDYFEYLLTEISKHMDDTDRSFLEDLLH